ncbi:hypothetical protein Syun_027271 [Stephania yunnanensis]|uniref:At1g61320/AtMIF1 LRR domain-containing protein n=1 Tax=Stephania yunnanensis TaxID=152371 RepID=A0AAP0EHM7_9MAGN
MSSCSSKICFNPDCKESSSSSSVSERPRKGWRIRSGELVELCGRSALEALYVAPSLDQVKNESGAAPRKAEQLAEFGVLHVKSVYDLDVHCPSYDDWDDLFVVPKRLFACPSIKSLKMRTCQFNPLQTFGGLKFLRFLYLKEACTSNKAFKASQANLENCLLLEELILQDSFCEYEMRILAPEDSQLKSLLVINSHLCDSDSHESNAARKIEVAVPNLKKVHFYGRLFDNYKFQNHLSLEEVCIDSTMHKRDEENKVLEDYFDHLRLLRDACNFKILTIYDEVIANVSELGKRYDRKDELLFNLPITLPNVQELQICLGTTLTKKCLVDVYAFFNNVRFLKLENLFIEVGYHDYGDMYESYCLRRESKERKGDGSFSNSSSADEELETFGEERLEASMVMSEFAEIEFALNKSIYDLDVYCPSYDDWDDLFVVLKRLFACPSITSLKLRTCQFNPPQTFGGLKSLRFLYLKEACISNKAFKATLENCLLLEELTLQDSFCEYEMRILAPEDSQHKSLLVINSHQSDSDSHEPNAARKIEVAVPTLKKVDFYGRLFDNYKFQNHLSLEEVCIDSTTHKRDEENKVLEDYFDHLRLLRDACNIKILTIYDELGKRYDRKDELLFNLPITMPNVQELQICLGTTLTKKCLVDVYAFFNNVRFPKLLELNKHLVTTDQTACLVDMVDVDEHQLFNTENLLISFPNLQEIYIQLRNPFDEYRLLFIWNFFNCTITP